MQKCIPQFQHLIFLSENENRICRFCIRFVCLGFSRRSQHIFKPLYYVPKVLGCFHLKLHGLDKLAFHPFQTKRAIFDFNFFGINLSALIQSLNAVKYKP